MKYYEVKIYTTFQKIALATLLFESETVLETFYKKLNDDTLKTIRFGDFVLDRRYFKYARQKERVLR